MQPGQIEAVNNKAWVLHMYLHRSQQALDVIKMCSSTPNRLCCRENSSTRSATSRKRWAAAATPKQSYLKGLKIARTSGAQLPFWQVDCGRSFPHRTRARFHLAKALEGRSQLSPAWPMTPNSWSEARPVDEGQLIAQRPDDRNHHGGSMRGQRSTVRYA